MQKHLVGLLFVAIAGLVFGADDPFEGTWKLNVAKSQLAPSQPGKAVKEQTMVVHENGNVTEVTIKGTRDDGSLILTKNTTPVQGGPVTYSENAPPAAVSVAIKRINSRNVELVSTRDGKEVTTQRLTVSADGKTLQTVTKTTDAQGKPVERLMFYERQ